MKPAVKILATALWNLSEFTGIGLGRFAPFVFGVMIGAKQHRVDGGGNG